MYQNEILLNKLFQKSFNYIMFLLKKPRYFYVMFFFLIIIYETHMHIIFLKKNYT
jgi:hypothetical protein